MTPQAPITGDEVADVLERAEAYRQALSQIAYMRPLGDVDTCANPRKLVERMEMVALAALRSAATAARQQGVGK